MSEWVNFAYSLIRPFLCMIKLPRRLRPVKPGAIQSTSLRSGPAAEEKK
jgi:hypothetical protein